MSGKYGKFLTPEEKESSAFSSADKNHLHRDTVQDSQDRDHAEVSPGPPKHGYTAERFSHINDAERPKQEARYGTVEKSDDKRAYFSSGVAGAAVSEAHSGVFKTEDRHTFSDFVTEPIGDSIKKDLTESSAAAFSEKIWSGKPAPDKSLLKAVADFSGKKAAAAAMRGEKDDDISGQVQCDAKKFGYKAGKYAALGGVTIGRGALRLTKYGHKLSKDVADGILTSSTAKNLFSTRAKQSLTGSMASLRGVIKTEGITAIEEIRGSEDLGIQAIIKSKDAVFGTRRSIKTVKALGRGVKQTVKITKGAASKVKATGKTIVSVGKKALSNPILIAKAAIVGLLIAIVLFIIFAIVASVAAIIPSFSLKSEEYEISQTYLYITELDAKMTDKIINEDLSGYSPPIDVVRYFVNDSEVSRNEVSVYTDADLILAYLDSKYQDYYFDGIIQGIFSTTVKGEVEALHSQLHQVKKVQWTETVTSTTTTKDPETGTTSTSTQTDYVYHLDIYLTTKTWEVHYEENKDQLLTSDQQQQYEALKEVGVYSFRKQLSSPFVGVDWLSHVSSRWGWRIHPVSGELKQHMGLDIAMPGGTPVNACNGGTVSNKTSSGFGNYVMVVSPNGSYTLYAHLSGFAVSDGQAVEPGDVIGYVGTTGTSTGNHLHLEYHDKNGHNLNPLIFVSSS